MKVADLDRVTRLVGDLRFCRELEDQLARGAAFFLSFRQGGDEIDLPEALEAEVRAIAARALATEIETIAEDLRALGVEP